MTTPQQTPQQHKPNSIELRAEALFSQRYDQLAATTDRIFAFLMIFQWGLAITFALLLSPKTWEGTSSYTHPHVYAALLIGFLLSGLPVYLIYLKPGAEINRMVVAISQILYSTLFIHLTGGRIETHFHIFGSLAFLAFYRDWRPVAIATVITAADHFFRGMFWPESVYGVLTATPWRALEHAAWVIFEDAILFASIFITRRELYETCESQAKLEFNLSSIEGIVDERTRELRKAKEETERQQFTLIQSSKLASLGEMAGGVAHEINNPIALIRIKASQLRRLAESDKANKIQSIEFLQVIEDTTMRISKVVDGLRTFARDGTTDTFASVLISKLFSDATGLCQEHLKSKGVNFEVVVDHDFAVECKAIQIEQVLVNLINNAFDAVSETQHPWIKIEAQMSGSTTEIIITDSGQGIPEAVQNKMLDPFFTTKPIGKGTGLGLSISHGIATNHGGTLTYNKGSKNTQFVLSIPTLQSNRTQPAA